MGNVAKYQHGWNMTFTVVELLMIIPKSTYLSISLPYFSIYHFFSLTLYLKDKIRWTEAMKDVANVPRLSTLSNENNYQTSTQWIEDGSFLKLRNLNVYYNLPQKWVKKIKLDKLQIYAKAQNVFSIDKIDYFNCEDLTLGYPDLFSVCLGLNINF